MFEVNCGTSTRQLGDILQEYACRGQGHNPEQFLIRRILVSFTQRNKKHSQLLEKMNYISSSYSV